jgi:sphingolipid 4-desaturase/C4-monooxygenase
MPFPTTTAISVSDVNVASRRAATAGMDTRECTTEPLKADHFLWTYTEEPHRTRRQAIVKAHPEVRRKKAVSVLLFGSPSHWTNLSELQVTKLCGPEPLTKYLVFLVVALQVSCAYLLRNTSFFSWPFFLAAYIVGATANQNLFLAIHEISHNLAFRSPTSNRLYAIFANLPIGLPYSAAFRVC